MGSSLVGGFYLITRVSCPAILILNSCIDIQEKLEISVTQQVKTQGQAVLLHKEENGPRPLRHRI